MTDRIEIGLIGIAVALFLIAIRTPIGVALALVSFVGICALTSFKAAWSILTIVPFNFITDWNLSAIPTFLLMGYVASQARLTSGLFSAMRMFFGRVPGGLASSTVIASALFASASGSSVATAAAFSRIAVPEMLKARYQPGLACGCVAAAGTLGSLIPPSILMILYGIFTDASISALFVAGVLPGILSAAMYIAMITVRCWASPELAPRSVENYSWAEKWRTLLDVWPLPALIAAVLGGIGAGFFTPTEAGAVGAFVAILIAMVRQKMTWAIFVRATIDTAAGTATIFIIAIGASMLSTFMALSGLPDFLSSVLLQYTAGPISLIIVIGVSFLILGMFIESISLILLTIPVVLPMLQALNIDLIWFGIILIKLLEIGLISPPLGMNVFVMKSSLGDRIPLSVMFRGSLWFIAVDLLTLALLIIFPAISLWLPGIMQ
ncbi:TRAP transporter large permease [Hoeflea sp.]|uniref:TRAP transporter large permease n=1 Tax=Hoeflea sp. TaxID=1940281 RepID=UPI000C1219D0|nr:TRAP transporter large permease [Hoeflea sp.]MBC7280571.1 TRAP transporter large permease [Hoeflea sp.]PHR17186.1 MAG: C4-dicarboxylate ABC transporter [Hoeflea sp.]